MMKTSFFPVSGGLLVRGFLLLLLGILLTGCAAQPPVPQDRFYRLQSVPSSEPLSSPIFAGTLEVERFSADGLTAGRPIVYVEANDPNQLLEYHYHFWTQPPTVMLRDELVSFLRDANVAKSIATPDMRLDPDYVMTGRIRQLEQVLGTPNRAVLELEIALRRPNGGELLFFKSYRREAEMSSRNVSAAVDALNTALNIIYSDLLADLRGL